MCLVAQRAVLAGPAFALGYPPKYSAGFAHFEYVNPDAPRRGTLTLSAAGDFDGLNPFLLKGVPAAGMESLVFETLMERSLDEPMSQYGLLAQDGLLAPDRRSVTFRLNPKAMFSDGTPVTAADVKFSFDVLKSEQAHPRYRYYWADISRAVVLDERTVRFDFSRTYPELHFLAGQVPVFSRRWGNGKPFDQVVMDPPIGSGPYVVERAFDGKKISYSRNTAYWARDLNVRRGMFNFDRITFLYYKDTTIQREAFVAGEFDFLAVNSAKQWERDFAGAKFERGSIRKVLLPHRNNGGMQGFVFNLRRPRFQDRRVRKALALALDFEWSNRNLFSGQYRRCDSYFSNSELAATGLPEGDELKLLEPFRSRLPREVFSRSWRPSSTAPPGSLRANLLEARQLLAQAGWTYREGALRNGAGEPFEFEILLSSRIFERVTAIYALNLAKLGVQARFRTVDGTLYRHRVDNFDFDMIVQTYEQSQSPGSDQINFWHSGAAGQAGSGNVVGVMDPVVDALLDKVVHAPDRKSQVTATRALDRVLLNGEYIVPHWYMSSHRVAHWNKFGFPARLPLYYSEQDLITRLAWCNK